MVPTFADPELHFFSPTHRYGQKYFPVSQLCLLDLQMPSGQWESQCQAPLSGLPSSCRPQSSNIFTTLIAFPSLQAGFWKIFCPVF